MLLCILSIIDKGEKNNVAAVSFPVPDETKNMAFEVIKSYGLSPTPST